MIALPVPRSIDPLAPVRAARSWLGNAEGRRHRRVAVNDNRAHIEVRGSQEVGRTAMRDDLRAALQRFQGVNWVEVDATLGRAVVLFDPEEVELDDLVSVVEDVEDAHDLAEERFPHGRADYPGDSEPLQRHLFAVAADTVGFGVAAAAQALHVVGIPAEIPGIVSLLEGQPRVRRFLEDRIGPPATDAALAATTALAQALGQGPLGLIVDMGHRGNLIAEHLARRAVWQRREPELVEGPHSVRHDPLRLGPRPPLPKGPIERYTDAAAIAALVSVMVTFGVTRDPRRAVDLVLTGVPKAANLGREAFAAHLDVALARADVMVMDPRSLRCLDRADTLVIDARLLASGRWSIDRLETVEADADPVVCTARARALLDVDDAGATRRRGSWALMPHSGDERAPRGTTARVRRLRRGGRRVLDLWRGDRLMAVVAVAEDPVPLAAQLVADARSTGLDVVLAGGTDALAERLGDVARWTATRVSEEIREHQRNGHLVMFVSGRAHTGLRAADIGIGVQTPGHRAPTAADVVIRQGLGQGWFLLGAVRAARTVSRQSALIALAGAGTGAAWSLIGPRRLAAQRTMLAINTSALLTMFNGAFAGTRTTWTAPPVAPPIERWHELSAAEALRRIGSSSGGLEPDEQLTRRLAETARIVRTPVGLVRATVDELANPLTPLLGAGAALSAAVGSLTDAGLVVGVVAVNALVGAAQRVRTDQALVELESVGETTVRVRVAGDEVVIPSEAVVAGDVVLLEAGDRVPGDCRVIDADALEVDESTLTGESLPVPKSVEPTPGAPVAERTSMLYDGTVVAAGTALAVVVAVGRDTEAGRSAAAAAEPPPSGVEQRLTRLTNLTVPVTLGAGAVATGLGFLYRRPLSEAVGTGVSLMVAAVPEGLPALATVSQLAAARRLAGRNALVRNPRAIEALGRVDQVCFDKTGTLTEGEVSVVCVSDGVEEHRLDVLVDGDREVLEVARRATPPTNGNGSMPHATDRAVVAAAIANGVDDTDTGWVQIEELPFESRRSFHAAIGRRSRSRALAVKGAPEVVLPMCATWRSPDGDRALDAETVRGLEDHVDRLARQGLRVLAVAGCRPPARFTLSDGGDLPPLGLVGFIGLADTVRPSAQTALGTLATAGVRTAMVTGDHPSTAEAIAADLGMLNGGRILTGVELDELDDEELDEVIGEIPVFARVTPHQKVRIVSSYRRAGRTVAMTGDGANDAAAIRLADVGIALGGRGTAAARSNADLVVLDDRIETIVDAVVEGRAMWESVRDAVAILVGGNLGEIGFTLVGSALGGSAPLNARQLLLVNLLTDMAPALAIALHEPRDRSPEALLHAGPDASLGGPLVEDIIVRAGATAAGATGAWMAARVTSTPTRARTVGLVALVGTQLGQTLVAGGPSPMVIGATAVSVGVLVAVVQTPGLSQFFGCRPLGPVGWSTAVTASVVATGASVVVPRLVGGIGTIIASARSRSDDPDGPGRPHLVLVDPGRSS